MPRHWRSLREKGDFEFRKDYKAANPGLEGELFQTRSVVVGGVTALGESLRLVAALSAGAAQPELAAFDCQSCHHELRSPAWRQARQRIGAPGRPRPAEWPAALVRIDPAPIGNVPPGWRLQFEDKLQQMQGVFDDRPFGDPEQLLETINGEAIDGKMGLVAMLDEHAAAIATTTFDEATLKRTLRALYGLDSSTMHDFHSARQVAWAIRVIEIECRTRCEDPKFLDRGDDETVEQRRAREESDQLALKDWQCTTQKLAVDEVNELMKPLETYLQLELPAGRTQTSDDFLKRLLEQTAAYDPCEFQKRLREASKSSNIRGIAEIGQPRTSAAPTGR
jgi:hypothetical protein